MAKKSLRGELAASRKGVKISKSINRDEFKIPAIEFSFRSNRDSPLSITIKDPLPSFYPVDQVVFHPSYEPENWTEDGQSLVFERIIEPEEKFKTLYGVRIDSKEKIRKFLKTPKLKTSRPSSSSSASESPSEEQILELITTGMDGYEFEHCIADIWERRGWETKVTDGSNDSGIDVVAVRDGLISEKHLLQVKKFTDSQVSSPDIQKYASLRLDSDVDAVIVITTSEFSDPAREIAQTRNVKLVNGHELGRLIRKMDATDVVKQYTD